jgi:hypothetical protein
MKKRKRKRKKQPADLGAPQLGRKGPPTNLRAGGPMADPRLRRRRTRKAEEEATLDAESTDA